MKASVIFDDMYICETKNGKQLECINIFTDTIREGERDNEGTSWFVNRGGFTLTSGATQVEGVKYTAKDHILTTISRLKNPSSFNVWYNDGENMLADVNSAYLIKNGVTQSVSAVKCCSISFSLDKTTFSTVNLVNGSLVSSNTTRMYREVEDEDGNISDEAIFYTASTTYNTYMKPVQTVNEDNIVTEYTYNEFGEVLSEKTYPTSNIAMNTLASCTYQNGNLASVTEKRYENEYTRTFEYNADDTLSSEITANGQYINYTHSPDGEKLTKLSATVGVENANTMAYTGDLLQSLSHNNSTFYFEYDERNAVNDIKINNASILSKTTTYGALGTQTLIQYANGANIKKYYDKYNRLIKVTEITVDSDTEATTETQLCAYLYHNEEIAVEIVDPEDSRLSRDSDTQLRTFIDSAAGTRTKYYYDEYGQLKTIWTDSIRELVAEKDAYNRTATATFIDGECTIKNHYTYKNVRSNEIESERVEAPEGDTNVYYERDALKRLGSVKVTQNGNGYKRAYNYVPRGAASSPESTTNYIESISYYNVLNNVATLEKTESIAYNADGNIVTYGENTYEYDRIGRLVRENNKALDKTFLFCYNEGGNIVSKTEYAYTTGIVGAATATYNYTYGNAWKDQLTSFGGQSIVYDASGNPTSYLGATLFWGRGRLLTQFNKGTTITYLGYDANGIRKSKSKVTKKTTVNSTYLYDSQGRLRTETAGTFTRNYLYSADGIIGYEENGERFIYRKNLFGDITAIYKGTTKVAEYVYDAWGNCTITLDNSGYGSRNPIRYRGYYWDEDLKMYYLMTRYYDPKIGRFINADSFEYLDPKTINGLNLYAYCGNNPIMNVDPSGHEVLSAAATWVVCQIVMIVILCGLYVVFVHWVLSLDLGNKEPRKEPQSKPSLPKEDVVIYTEGFIGVANHTSYSHNGVSNPEGIWYGRNEMGTFIPNRYLGDDGGGSLPDHSGYDIWDENGWEIK